MKKLNLKATALYGAEVLTRAQMKSVVGAYMLPPGCTNACTQENPCLAGQTCYLKACPDDANFNHYVCG